MTCNYESMTHNYKSMTYNYKSMTCNNSALLFLSVCTSLQALAIHSSGTNLLDSTCPAALK